MSKPSFRLGIRVAFAAIGIFGAAFAISGLLIALPKPAAGGTCGPGTGSEAPIVAVLNPGSIGAGQEPAASNTASHEQWLAFVGECQASADGTVLAALAILVAASVVAIAGPWIVLRRRRDPTTAT